MKLAVSPNCFNTNTHPLTDAVITKYTITIKRHKTEIANALAYTKNGVGPARMSLLSISPGHKYNLQWMQNQHLNLLKYNYNLI